MSAGKFVRSNLIITTLSLVGVAINFVSQMVLAYYFGAKTERDAYFSAAAVPAYIVTLFVGSITAVFLPFYINLKTKVNELDLRIFGASSLGLCALAIVLIALAGFTFSQEMMALVAPGYNGAQLQLTIQLFNILIFAAVFQTLSNFIAVFYHVENSFLLPAISPIITPVTSLVIVLLFHSYGIQSLAFGTLIGSILSLILLLPRVSGQLAPMAMLKIFNPNTREVFQLAMPLFISGAVYRLTTIIERTIGSRLPEGSVSYLGYSSQIYILLATIASGSLGTTFFPILSKAWSEGDTSRFRLLLTRAFLLTFSIILPIACILIVHRNRIIEMLFQRGAFDAHATVAVATSLSILMAAFIFSSLGNILTKAFYIANRTFIVGVLGISELIIYTACGYMLAQHYSYLGLSSALSLSTGWTLILFIVFLFHWKLLDGSILVNDVFKLIVASMVCCLVIYIVYKPLAGSGNLLSTLISSFIGVACYLVSVLYVMKISEAELINKTLKSYLSKYFHKVY